MVKVAEGHDPAKQRADARAPKPERSMAALIERFLKANARKRTENEMRRRLEKHVVPVLGDRAIDTVTKPEIADLCDAIEAPVMANRTFETLRLFFNWAIGRGLIDVSPMAGLKKPNPDHEQARKRVLSDDELRKLWKATGEIGEPFGPLVRLLVLTGQRRGEVAGMMDSEIVGDLWTIPGDRVKNGHDHTVPLTALVLAELAKVTRIGDKGLIFTTTGTRPVSGWGRVKDRLDRLVGFDDWRIHDLRRTVATGLQRLGVPLQVTEAVLNHTSGTRDGIVGVYQTYDYHDEKADALRAWSHYVEWIVTDDLDKVRRDWLGQCSPDRVRTLDKAHKRAIEGSDRDWRRYMKRWHRVSRWAARRNVLEAA
jgi:integrase